VMPSGLKPFRPGPVRMAVGAPILTAGRPMDARDALVVEVREALVALHDSLASTSAAGARDLPRGPAPAEDLRAG